MDINIRSVAELSIQKLEDLEEKGRIHNIIIESETKKSVYSVSEYKKVYQKLLELTEGIDLNWSQTKKFVLIYRRVSENIEYDYIARLSRKRKYRTRKIFGTRKG